MAEPQQFPPGKYFPSHYRQDLGVFVDAVEIPRNGPFGVLCGRTLGNLFEPSKRPRFASPSGFLWCLYESAEPRHLHSLSVSIQRMVCQCRPFCGHPRLFIRARRMDWAAWLHHRVCSKTVPHSRRVADQRRFRSWLVRPLLSVRIPSDRRLRRMRPRRAACDAAELPT